MNVFDFFSIIYSRFSVSVLTFLAHMHSFLTMLTLYNPELP